MKNKINQTNFQQDMFSWKKTRVVAWRKIYRIHCSGDELLLKGMPGWRIPKFLSRSSLTDRIKGDGLSSARTTPLCPRLDI